MLQVPQRVFISRTLSSPARLFTVRSMAGSIAEVGLGRWSPVDLADALEARDRARCGPVAPSDGLYLTGVTYEAET